MEEEKEQVSKTDGRKPQKQYRQTKTTKYHTKEELVLAWVNGNISLESILKMFRSLNYGQDRRTRKELYRGAIHKIYKIKADIIWGHAQDKKRIKEQYGEEVVQRELDRNKRPKQTKESDN